MVPASLRVRHASWNSGGWCLKSGDQQPSSEGGFVAIRVQSRVKRQRSLAEGWWTEGVGAIKFTKGVLGLQKWPSGAPDFNKLRNPSLLSRQSSAGSLLGNAILFRHLRCADPRTELRLLIRHQPMEPRSLSNSALGGMPLTSLIAGNTLRTPISCK